MKKQAASFRNALEGIIFAFKTERNFRFHLATTVVVYLFAGLYQVSPVELFGLTLAIFSVLVAELFNTAVEALVDHLAEGEHHHFAKMAKDLAAAAVLFSSIGAGLVGIIVFGPKILGI